VLGLCKLKYLASFLLLALNLARQYFDLNVMKTVAVGIVNDFLLIIRHKKLIILTTALRQATVAVSGEVGWTDDGRGYGLLGDGDWSVGVATECSAAAADCCR